MILKDYVANRIDKENSLIGSSNLNLQITENVNDIVALYRTYDGIKRHMRALSEDKVEEYLANGYAFVGAYYDKQLAGIAVSKQLPKDFPYFTLPKNEEQGNVYSLGGLYVNPNYQGLGIASKLSRTITEGTKDYAIDNTQSNIVGMGYEVCYDNYGSLKILSKQGNYVGFYSDSDWKEGLTILLYKPYLHEAVKVDRPNILLTSNEQESLQNLTNGLEYISNQEGMGGITEHIEEVGSGVVTTVVLDNTPNTIPEPTFEMLG